jgi:subtilisin family serine protease
MRSGAIEAKERMVNTKAIEARKILVAAVVLAVIGLLHSEERTDIVCIGLHHSAVLMPEGKTAAALDEVTITIPEVESVLQVFAAESIALTFPGFSLEDTIGVSLTGRTVRLPDLRDYFDVTFSTDTLIDSACVALDSIPDIMFAERSVVAELFVEPNDDSLPGQWNLKPVSEQQGQESFGIDATRAWDFERGTGSDEVRIAIHDVGVYSDHEDFRYEGEPKRVTGDEPLNHNPLPPSPYHNKRSHGTQVAGIAAACADNTHGIAGIDWQAQVISKSLLSSGSSARQIEQLLASPPHVLNMCRGRTPSEMT